MRRFVYLILCAILVVSIPGLLFASNKTVKVGIYQNKPKGFVEKPYQIEQLLKIIRQVLDDHPQVDSAA